MESKQNNQGKFYREAEKYQYEIASEKNKIPMGYAGTVGGNMVKKMIEKAEKDMMKNQRRE